MITGPGGIDVLVEPGEWEPVAAIASRAARQLDLDPNIRWTLTDQAGRPFDQAASGGVLFAANHVELIDPDHQTTTEAAVPSPDRHLEPAAATSEPPMSAPVVRYEEAQPVPVLRPALRRPNRPALAAVASAVLVAVVAAVAGYAFGHRAEVAVAAPVVVTAPPRAVLLAGFDPALGPIGGLSAERTARPGQLVTAPAPTTGTATGWRWQRCNETGEDCHDIPGATDPMYPSPPTPDPLTIRVLVDTATNGTTITWASATFQALPEPPPTTTTTSTTTTTPTTVAPTPAEEPVAPE